jgi:Acetyltransferase (GNAT) domain
MLAVQPKLQDRGIGRSIMRGAEQICHNELGAKEIRMHVLYMRSDIIAWYERLGYRRNGERAPFPYGDERVHGLSRGACAARRGAGAADLINTTGGTLMILFKERAILLNQASNAQIPAFYGGVRVRRCQRSVEITVVGGRK